MASSTEPVEFRPEIKEEPPFEAPYEEEDSDIEENEAYYEYVKDIIDKDDPLTCKICGKKYESRRGITYHRFFHEGHNYIQCQICNAKVSEPYFEQHVRVIHVEKTIPCDKCDRKFRRASQLASHYRVHTGELFHCSICNRGFVLEKSLEIHYRIHTDSKPFQCNLCEKTFNSKIRLKSHMEAHDGKVFACEACPNVYKSRESLRLHMRTHTKIGLYTCDICDAEFTVRRNLDSHKKRKHSSVKPFQCTLCESAFKVQLDLNIHMRKHTEEGGKEFSCTMCDKKFTANNRLKLHMDVVHLGITFPCSECGKIFRTIESLRLHMKLHTQIGLSACEICGRQFTTKRSYDNHKRTVHGIEADANDDQETKEIEEVDVPEFNEFVAENVKVEMRETDDDDDVVEIPPVNITPDMKNEIKNEIKRKFKDMSFDLGDDSDVEVIEIDKKKAKGIFESANESSDVEID